MTPAIQKSFFDNKFETMKKGHGKSGEWAFCYEKQTSLLSAQFKDGDIVLDIGCGPVLPYAKPKGVFVVGLEPSFDSIRANQDVDLRVCGSALAVPMANKSVDVIVCFYSIHHMVSTSIEGTKSNVARAFSEFGRVLKPDGRLFVFEMTPMQPFSAAQALLWNPLRRAIPDALDMYFWSASSIAQLAHKNLPASSTLETFSFGTSPLAAIAPIFNLPWFKVPRMLYPLDAKLYKWHVLV